MDGSGADMSCILEKDPEGAHRHLEPLSKTWRLLAVAWDTVDQCFIDPL